MSKSPIDYINTSPFPVYVGVAFNEQGYLKELKRLGIEEGSEFYSSTAGMKSFVSSTGKLNLIVCFDPIRHKKLHRNQIAALLAHECVHVCDAIFKEVGETSPGEETRAYTVQYYLQEILFLMDAYMKRKRN